MKNLIAWYHTKQKLKRYNSFVATFDAYIEDKYENYYKENLPKIKKMCATVRAKYLNLNSPEDFNNYMEETSAIYNAVMQEVRDKLAQPRQLRALWDYELGVAESTLKSLKSNKVINIIDNIYEGVSK